MSDRPRRLQRNLTLESLSQRKLFSVNVELLMDINFGDASAVTRPEVVEVEVAAGQFVLDFEPTLEWDWVEFDGDLYFAADDGVHGMELWKTDGTEDGTDMVVDIFAASDSSLPTNLTVFDGSLYFAATDGDSGDELWKTDGTDVGTERVKDIWAGPGSAFPREFAVYKDELYFSAGTEAEGDELWKTDGTEEGTVLVTDIAGGEQGSFPRWLYVFNDELYFSAAPLNDGPELFKSDGTAEGTVLVKNINPAAATPSFPESFFEFKDELFFVAGDSHAAGGQIATRLFKTDGTETGTVRVTDVRPFIERDRPAIVEFKDHLYFSGISTGGLWEMFRTDGNPGNTELVMDLDANFSGVPTELTVFQNQIYFAANDETARQLWKTNGELGDANVSERLTSLENGATGMFPTEIHVFNGELFWNGSDGTNFQVWRSDGDEIESITDFEADQSTLDLFHYNLFTEFDNKLFFRGADRDSGLEMWLIIPDQIFDPEPLPGDTDGNGKVDFLDFLVLADNFGKQNAETADGDVDGNGEVNFLDFLALANNFGREL